jgi:hypothetical protein
MASAVKARPGGGQRRGVALINMLLRRMDAGRSGCGTRSAEAGL